jgi:hypothetical protein
MTHLFAKQFGNFTEIPAIQATAIKTFNKTTMITGKRRMEEIYLFV